MCTKMVHAKVVKPMKFVLNKMEDKSFVDKEHLRKKDVKTDYVGPAPKADKKQKQKTAL